MKKENDYMFATGRKGEPMTNARFNEILTELKNESKKYNTTMFDASFDSFYDKKSKIIIITKSGEYLTHITEVKENEVYVITDMIYIISNTYNRILPCTYLELERLLEPLVMAEINRIKNN
jgi:hypothetical protein